MKVSEAMMRDVRLTQTKHTSQDVAAIMAGATVMTGGSGSSRSAISW
ncbi:hypothetical protein MPEAHAMD_6885 [Methylobacterium frigidaeris]|uniref:Uncharacterized protein n=1 Tax=Methylobacterium frigidaeris TaxID=2038277 RepID=A0AA37HID4_9HYPH|nr:hypothetical protein MPEAHAMD_6885 [Methylobacterium frigidaeris]